MGSALSLGPCSRFIEDHEWAPEEVFIQKMMRRALENDGARLALIVAAMPVEDPTGTSLTLFPSDMKVGTVWVERLEKVKSWLPLGLSWRAAAAAREGGGGGPHARPSLPRVWEHWRAKVTAESALGQREELWCLLQVATSPQDRTTDQVLLDIKSTNHVASYARDFNRHLHQLAAATGEPVPPGVRVCVPIGCKVVQSPVPHFFVPGDMVTLLPYRAEEVTKFVYKGKEPYLELPQALFHYVAWKSGGRELVIDLQGLEEEDGSLVLVNPSLTKPADRGAGTRVPPNYEGGDVHATPELFDRLHPQCGPLCRSFDPERRSRPVRRQCGLAASCGVAGHDACQR